MFDDVFNLMKLVRPNIDEVRVSGESKLLLFHYHCRSHNYSFRRMQLPLVHPTMKSVFSKAKLSNLPMSFKLKRFKTNEWYHRFLCISPPRLQCFHDVHDLAKDYFPFSIISIVWPLAHKPLLCFQFIIFFSFFHFHFIVIYVFRIYTLVPQQQSEKYF